MQAILLAEQKKAAMVGFHGRKSETILPVPFCILLKPELIDAQPCR